MKSGRSLSDLAAELLRQVASKEDIVAPSRLIRYETDPASLRSEIVVERGDGPSRFGVTELARRQLSDKLGIPFAYFQRMEASQPALLDRNVNTWLHDENEQEPRMLRTLDGKVRAVLSNRYRCLDNFDLAEHVIPILRGLEGARFESVELTETRLYLKIVTPRVRYEIAPGDVVQAGVVISNSEVGCGSVSVQPLVYRLACKNGLISADRSLRKNHVGRIIDVGDQASVVYKDDTLQAADRAFYLGVRDVVQAAVSEAEFMQVAEKMKRTRGIVLTASPEKCVEVMSRRYTLNEAERTGVLRQLVVQADLSGYGLLNAVTGFSQQVADYDRATELETVGGKLLDLTQKEWKEIAEAI